MAQHKWFRKESNSMKRVSKCILWLSGSLTSFASVSSNSAGYITDSGIHIIPIIETKIEHIDNVGRLSESESLESSTVSILKPGVVFLSNRNGNRYELAYRLSSGSYFNSMDDSFLDHFVISHNTIQINPRNSFQLNYELTKGHEERGTGLLAGDELSKIATEPVRYTIHNVDFGYSFGSKGAKGKIESGLKYLRKEHINYREINNDDLARYSTRYKDFEQLGGSLAFYYRLSHSTQLIAQLELFDKNYSLAEPENNQSQDSFNSFYYFGAEWDVTGKTTGRLRLGLQNKDYESSARKDFSGLSWKGDLDWRPAGHSTISIMTGMEAEDSAQDSTYLDRMNFSSQWQHFWLSYFYTRVGFSLSKEDYSESERKDKLNNIDVSIGYSETEDADISMGWRYEKNDSTLNSNTYSQNVWYLSASLAF